MAGFASLRVAVQALLLHTRTTMSSAIVPVTALFGLFFGGAGYLGYKKGKDEQEKKMALAAAGLSGVLLLSTVLLYRKK